MKEQLLKLFAEQEGQFISGEKMSQKLGYSRTAVWKHIEELRKQGYELESAPRKGYRLIKSTDGIRPHEVGAKLKTARLGREQTYFDTITTTQSVAHEKAQEGVAEGHVIIANEQTEGKGRLGRHWFSQAGSSISMSLILRPTLPPRKTPQLTLLAAVAVVKAIEKETGLRCDIKWPNDILLNGKKLVGILTEMHADPDYVHSVIIGIGLNVNQQETDIEPAIRELATSLSLEKGTTIKRASLLAQILNEFEPLYDMYLKEGFRDVRKQWEAYSISVNTYLYARTTKEVIYGFAKGITDDGVLLLIDESGKEHLIYSADIELDSH